MKNIDFKEKLSYFYPRDNYGIDISADRDWRIVISLFWIILLIVILWSAYGIWQLKNVKSDESTFVKTLTLKEELLDKIIKNIDEKKAHFDELLIKNPEIKDPSI
ncbi:MAG: hypothetical protein COU71_00630 [Parcubacteria group bacterium CG10_big_fil_rev_8_21_14_0_10_38_31]|nr:MAG: hypothetical protein COU71_00630 [Parcubacteria group bacterium CG10_big_fil_rev_8_21_14_0_10_38_31]